MIDMEKVKKALERCLICDISVVATPEAQKAYLECEYTVGLYCGQKRVLRDALALLNEQREEIENLKQTAQSMMEGVCLLKEQEPVKPVRDEETGRIWLCGKCGTYVGFEDNDPHDPNEYDKYCRECGRPVLWEGR